MKKFIGMSLILIVLTAGCSPSTPPPIPPTSTPTSVPTPVVENPPPCWEADLIYHAQLKQMLLVNCVPDPSKETPNVIWGWNGSQWQRVTEGGPSRRILGGAAYDEKRNVLILYGGRPIDLGKCNQETWEWDGQAWEQKNVSPPTACDHVRMIYDSVNEETILFSGLDPSENPVNDTWSWNGIEWKLLSEEGPESRGHFGFVYDPNHSQILLYGGYATTLSDEFWTWKDGAWQEIDFPGPGKLSHFGMAYDIDMNASYIFGGATRPSTFSSLTNKFWILSGGSWRELHPPHSPSKRGSPAMAYDPIRKRIILYGGFDSNRGNFSDTWEWDGADWTCLANCE